VTGPDSSFIKKRKVRAMVEHQPPLPPPEEDCLECKLVGTTAFGVSGAYVLHSSRSLPKGTSPAGKILVQCMGVGLIGLAILRATAGPISRKKET